MRVTGGIRRAFALPVVLTTSLVMMLLLLIVLSGVTSSNALLQNQYEDRLVQEAGEAGGAMARACLRANNYIAQWTTPLRPDTDCNGTTIATPTTVASIGNYRTSFSVPVPAASGSDQIVQVNATISRVRTSNSSVVVESRSKSVQLKTSAQVAFNNVALGYTAGFGADDGAQYAAITSMGKVIVAGRNNNGRLGNGTLTDSATPVYFNLPGTEKAVRVYSSPLSIGRNVYVVTESGKVYGAGNNAYGQLGIGSTASPQSSPQQMQLPGGSGKAVLVVALQEQTYVITDSGKLYAMGYCNQGVLGVSCTQGSYVTVPTQVVMPNNETVVTSPGDWVLPTNIVADRLNVYVIATTGKVYGWGINDYGQLGTGDFTTRTTPVQVGYFNNSYIAATQLAYNGETIYVLGSTGVVGSAGRNHLGQMGAPSTVGNIGSPTVCIAQAGDNAPGLVPTCDENAFNQRVEWRADGTFRPAWDAGKCYTRRTADNKVIVASPCNPADINAQWTYNQSQQIVNSATGLCLSAYADLYLDTCGAWGAYQQWLLRNSPIFYNIPIPGSAGAVTKISSDNGSLTMLTSNSQVWSVGSNNRGQLCGGTIKSYNPAPVKAAVPAPDVDKATNIYTAAADPNPITTGLGYTAYNNTFIVNNNGTVYGCGANNYGQLGLGNTTTPTYSVPQKMTVFGTNGVNGRSVLTAYGTTMILTTNGRIYTVGNNSNGQLGDGTTASTATPGFRPFLNQLPSTIF